jgi:riboflavin synthase alpha subunit
MAPRLYRVGGFCVQGFVDATGELMAQSEVSPHWRKMRGKPTHWMPLPAGPIANKGQHK